MAPEQVLAPDGVHSRRGGWSSRPAGRFLLTLVPVVGLAALLIVHPLTIQGAPPAQPSSMEVVSDAPVCVRYYPATGETREGPEICATRAGDPPPPAASTNATGHGTGGVIAPVIER